MASLLPLDENIERSHQHGLLLARSAVLCLRSHEARAFSSEGAMG